MAAQDLPRRAEQAVQGGEGLAEKPLVAAELDDRDAGHQLDVHLPRRLLLGLVGLPGTGHAPQAEREAQAHRDGLELGHALPPPGQRSRPAWAAATTRPRRAVRRPMAAYQLTSRATRRPPPAAGAASPAGRTRQAGRGRRTTRWRRAGRGPAPRGPPARRPWRRCATWR